MDAILFRKSWFKTMKRWEPDKVYQFISILERYMNGENYIIPNDMMDFWDQVEPLLKSDFNKYENIVERNRQNGKLGGRPKKDENPTEPKKTQENQVGYLETQENPKNLKEKEKDIDKEKDKEKEKVGGFEKLLQVFPTQKVSNQHECLALWDSLSQKEKQSVIRHSSVYIKEMKSKNQEQYIKNLHKYLQDRFWENSGNSSTVKTKTISRGGLKNYSFIKYIAKISKESESEVDKFLYGDATDEQFLEAYKMYEDYKKENNLP